MVEIANQHKSLWGTKAIQLNRDGTWSIGIIKRVLGNSQRQIWVEYEEQINDFISCQSSLIASRRLVPEVTDARCIIPLVNCNPYEDPLSENSLKVAISNPQNARNHKNKIFVCVELDALRSGTEVIWLRTNFFSKPVGKIVEVWASIDVTCRVTWMVYVQFDEYALGIETARGPSGESIYYQIMDCSELWILQNSLQSLPNEKSLLTESTVCRFSKNNVERYDAESQQRYVPIERSKIPAESSDKLYRVCNAPSCGDISTFAQKITPGTEITFRNDFGEYINGVAKRLLLIDDISFVEGTFGSTVDCNNLEHNVSCTSTTRYRCNRSLLVPTREYFNRENSQFRIQNKAIKPVDTTSNNKTPAPSGSSKHLQNNGTPTPTEKGIQGANNSCYLDSSIFILFGFNPILQNYLKKIQDGNSKLIPKNMKVVDSLVTIVRELKDNCYVPSYLVKILRDQMTSVNSDYAEGFMDAEDLILNLLDEIGFQDFFSLDGGGSDKIHQLIVPDYELGVRTNANKVMPIKELKSLIEDSIWYNNIKLLKKPFPVFILKLPFNNGKQMYGCQSVIPNLEMDISKFIKEPAEPVKLALIGMLCLKSQHYVSFAKTDTENLLSPWVFMDSNPTAMKPKVEYLRDLGNDLLRLEASPALLLEKKFKTEMKHPDAIEFICSNCYICIYK